MHLKNVAHSSEEVRHELRSVIGEQCCWRIILEHPVFYERKRDVIRRDALQGDHLCQLGEAIRDKR